MSTAQAAGGRLRSRLRSWRPTALALLALLISALIGIWATPRTSSIPMAIDNPKSDGAMAVAELLGHEGISVSSASSVDQAIQAAKRGSSVAVINPSALSQTDRERLAEAKGDVTVVGTLYSDLTGLSRLSPTGSSLPESTPTEAQCADEDASAAQTIASSRGSLSTDQSPEAIGCFPLPAGSYAYAVEPLPGGGTLRVIADATLVTNERLADEGHAALAIRALGHHEELVWLDAARASSAESVWNSPLTPPWLPVLMLHLCLAALVTAIIRGRRFGPIITEPLPTVVRSSETTIARGRLYRRAADRERAAQALRRATAIRLARTLGMGSAASRDDLLNAVASASGRPRPAVAAVLDGPIPPNDHALAALAVELDQLESEVHAHG
ncbi:DUF4350 domain-containing protein [Actinomyces slackii]|uniref:DUF4350 domain-containing protein n=1 Tax=Actinomyces slackii TaxID=52774 RepID=A0A3S4U3U0_9ACTO|nr:DUF4350 domain-containing protein [Actinomyces slackii]VEG75839.1 Uncharacterised protein [Actinomyces slackii]